MKTSLKMFLVLLVSTIIHSVVEAQTPDSSSSVAKRAELSLPAAAYDTTSISFKDTDLRDIFRALTFEHGINIFVDNAITRKTTISLHNVRVYDALSFLCSQNNLLLVNEGGIFKVLVPPPPIVVPPPPRVPAVYYDSNGLSVELKNDDLNQVVLEIQTKANRNILITNGTSGTVTGKLNDIEFDIGFTQLMNNNGFAVQKKNNIYVVSRLEYFNGSAQQGPKSGPYWVSVKDTLVSIDVTNAPLERTLGDIVRQLNTDIVYYNAVTGTVTARATSVPLTTALNMILRNTNYAFRESEGIYYVGEKTNKALITSKLLKLKYLRPEKVLELVPASISSMATLKAMKEHNAIIASASSDVIGQLEEYIRQVDKPVAQVLIEAIVVDYDLSDGREFGIKAGFKGSADTTTRGGDIIIPGLDVQVGGATINTTLKDIGKVNILGNSIDIGNLGRLPGNFYLNLKAMEEKGLANVRSRPLISTLNGSQASLSIGTTQYYILKTTTPYRDQTQTVFQETQAFQTIEADVKLELTPYVGADGLIIVEIKPDFKTPVGALSSAVPPTINRRAMSSTVEMREGETIVLGGLIQDIESETRSQVPLLGSIPLLGALFSSSSKTTRKTELVIYVTPHISYGEAFQNVELPDKERNLN